MAGDSHDPVNPTPATPVVVKGPKPQPPANDSAPPPAEDVASKQAYFCLEANHPGQSTPRADTFDLGRMFYSDSTGAPTCPLCRKQVSAYEVDDTTKLPPVLQATAERLAVAERQR